MVSEFMLQQTPVERVLPAWDSWMRRWPTPAALAASPIGDAVRAWGRLGYPRRALRLHQAASAIAAQHDGVVPADYEALRALPGVGDYTASAILAFAFERRSIVLDTNVRRVLARTRRGESQPASHVTKAERENAAAIWPTTDRTSARWSAAVMEFGALVCRARSPQCDDCPIAGDCRWHAAGKPMTTTSRRQQEYAGSDRQIRGEILRIVRESTGSVSRRRLARVAGDADQRDRALASLLADGLVAGDERVGYSLP